MVSRDLLEDEHRSIDHQPLILNWLGWFFRPHPSLTDDLSRRRSQLLAGMMAVTIATAVVGIIYTVWRKPVTLGQIDTWLIVAGVLIIAAAMVINRRGDERRGAQIFIGIMVPVFILLPFIPGANDDLGFFVVIPVLVTTIFFSANMTAYLAVSITVIST